VRWRHEATVAKAAAAAREEPASALPLVLGASQCSTADEQQLLQLAESFSSCGSGGAALLVQQSSVAIEAGADEACSSAVTAELPSG
jgi:hypothetical protein